MTTEQDLYNSYCRTYDLFDLKSPMIRVGYKFIRRDEILQACLRLIAQVPCFELVILLKDKSSVHFKIRHSYDKARQIAQEIVNSAL